MKSIVTSLIFSALALSVSAADARYTPAYKKAFGYITQLRFAEAKALVKGERSKDSDNKTGAYLEAVMICAEIFANEDQARYAEVQDRIDELIVEIEDVESSNPFRRLYIGEIYVARATLNGKFKNNIKAAWQFYKAYNLLTENARLYPSFMPNKIPLGVLYAGIGSLPDDYRSLASLLGFDGSVQRGIAMVKEAFWRLSADEELSFYRPYAGFVYSYVTYQLGATNDVSPDKLGLDVANSSFLIFAQAVIELENGNAQKAVQWLDARPQGQQYFQFAYLDYLQGKILLGLNPNRSVEYFEKYLKVNRSGVYIKSTYRYLSWYYLLKGQTVRAEEMRENIFRKGNTNTGADRQALEEATKGFNKTLIEARVLFDVGEYKKAESVLKNTSVGICCTSAAEEAEYYYRFGRIYQEMEKTDQAIAWFKKALAVENAASNFAVGNSALQLGVMHEQNGLNSKAMEYYRKTLKYSGYPFYEGVHQKAKTGIARLKG